MKANHSRDPILVVIAVVLAMVATMATTSVAAENAEVDTTAPQTTITFPTRNIVVEAGNSLEVLGHASDDTAVRKVDVAIRDRVNKTWWWGADQGFETGWPRPHAITGQPVGGGWPTNFDWEAHGDLVFLPPGSYAAYARAFDTSGNYDLTPAWVPFRVAAPMLDSTLHSPTDGETVDAAEVNIRGRAQGNQLGRVAVAIVDRASKQWLQPDGLFGAPFALHDALLDPDDPNADIHGIYMASWAIYMQLPEGSYGMSVRAYDDKGRVETTRTWIRFSAEADPFELSSGLAEPSNGDSWPAEFGIGAEGTAAASNGVARVRVAVRNQATREWLQPDGTFGPSFRLHNADHDPTDPYLADWFWSSGEPLPPGEYGMSVRTVDTRGNVEAPASRPWVTFTLT